MVSKKNIRSYEVSIWTLQDSFITVLKPLNLEYKGAIQDGKITLQDDGENRISFSIPMYIMNNGELIENPLWYNKNEGNLIANLRKLKVIFNKKTANEKVFEFLITKVTERHEGFEKTCAIEGEGLAFNELGKQGYKISLSAEDLYAEVDELTNELAVDDVVKDIVVKNNINYWVDKVLTGTNWEYSIQMDWTAIDGIIDTYEPYASSYEELTEEDKENLNTNRADLGLRRHDCIYEDAYVSSWDIVNNALIPKATVGTMEKLRTIESSDSNRYNLLQTIAETFEVYTKFEYYYDDNYHIIKRKVIFYNNFLDENEIIDLNYNYETKSVSRELNATDIITKMYVKTLDDETSPSGIVSIADTEINKTREDYLLNFDYLYSINTISEEQYAAIKEFEKEIFNLNQQIIGLDKEIINLNQKILDAEIARDNALLIMKQAQENINYINDQIKQINDTYKDLNGNTKTEWEVLDSNPAFVYVYQNQDGTYTGKFGSQYSGIESSTIIVYANRNDKNGSKIPISYISADNTLSFKSGISAPANGYFYATFKYDPNLKNKELLNEYQILFSINQKKYVQKIDELGRELDDNGKEIKVGTGFKDDLEIKENNKKILYEQKQQLICKFENMMGPALREGNWQPEDEYSSYGNQYDETLIPSYKINSIENNSNRVNFIWDRELFDDEEKNYYESGVNLNKVYYPCLDLTKINSNFLEKLTDEVFRNELTFVYKIPNSSNSYLLPQGTSCKFAFIQDSTSINEDIIPVLMLTNLDYDISANTECYIASVSVDTLIGNIDADNDTIFSVPSGAWITSPENYKIVYPRLKMNVENLKTGVGELFLNIYKDEPIQIDNIDMGKVYTYIDKLEEFVDYYILSREGINYITIKPEVLIHSDVGSSKIKINYSTSNAALQIYLDAIKIMKENAYPKVSYTINNILSSQILYNTYNRLGQLVHINDAELKFENVMGYISAVELNLEKPWEDSITIQNYKNKFEDLFSTIVAQTEEMKKNAARLNVAANAFAPNGTLIAPLTQETLLKSPRVLNTLIKNNADIIATRAIGQAASDKAALAMTRIYSVMNGNVGLAFNGNNIDSVALNQDDGLVVAGKVTYNSGNNSLSKSVFFKLDNANMGFFEGEVGDYTKPQLYYDNGDLALSGTIYAKHGWFGGDRGWIIGQGLTSDDAGKLNYINSTGESITTTISDTDLGGLLFSANGKVIFTTGTDGTDGTDSTNPKIILSKNGFPNINTTNGKADALFLFDGDNLYVNGIINAVAGNIGGWTIGEHYLGNKATQLLSTVGIASGKDNLEATQKYSFWAGGAYNATGSSKPKFSVTPDGLLTATDAVINGEITATSGTLGGWAINPETSSIDSRRTHALVYNSGQLNSNYFITASLGLCPVADEVVIWAGGIRNANQLLLNGHTRQDFENQPTNYESGDFYNNKYAIKANTSYQELDWLPLAPFRVTKGGKLYATNAEISGKITADNGAIGDFRLNNGILIATYTNQDITRYTVLKAQGTYGLVIGSPAANSYADAPFKVSNEGKLYANDIEVGANNNSLTYNSSDGLIVKGTIDAKAGTIGGWNIGSNYIGNASTLGNSTVGLHTTTSDSVKVFWAGGAYTDGDPNFYVQYNGKIVAKSGTVGGWSINSSSFYFSNETPGATTSTLVLSKGITTTNPIGNSSGSNTWMISAGKQFGVTTNGILYANNAVLSGSLTSGSNFSVTSSGVMTAKRGTIGGWNISDTSINTAIPDSVTSSTVRHLFSNTSQTALAIGAPVYTSADADQDHPVGTGKWSKAPFRVTDQGQLIASGASITGATVINTDGANFSVSYGNSFIMKAWKEVIEGVEESGVTLKVNANSMEMNQYATTFSEKVNFDNGFDVLQAKAIYNTSSYAYTVIVSTSPPSYHVGCPRMLWIKPTGGWKTIDNLTGEAMSCEIYWCRSNQ